MSTAVSSTPHPASSVEAPAGLVRSGIAPLDERLGGFIAGGSYLIVGSPGPAKSVAALHFLHAGAAMGERTLLLTASTPDEVLDGARAWGLELQPGWIEGALRILGFKDDFELRAVRSLEPDEVIAELDQLVGPEPVRIAIDPGSLFLGAGARSLLGSAFLAWARRHPATVCTTFSVDGDRAGLPAVAEWLVHATTGRLMIDTRTDDLHEISLLKSVPEPHDRDEPVSVRLKPGAGFMRPDGLPARRNRDRAGVDDRRLLLVSLGGSHGADLETWARAAFTADVVSEPFDAVAHIQGIGYGAVLVHAPRSRVREAISACRAMRPLTRAAIVFASDDAVRATDRIQILASGADDCVSGGIALPELDLRLRQAIASGARPLQNGNGAHGSSMTSLGSAPGLDGGRVPKDVFDAELERRAADPMLRFFCVLSVTSDVLDMGQLAEILARQVRFDEGDLVVADADRCVVLLQGAREAQLGPFVERLRSRLDQWGDHRSEGGNGVTVLSHPTQAAQIAALLGTPRAIRS